MTTADKAQKPWTTGARCSACGLRVGTPVGEDAHPAELRCCACGARWTEQDVFELSSAWFGHGANEAREFLATVATDATAERDRYAAKVVELEERLEAVREATKPKSPRAMEGP